MAVTCTAIFSLNTGTICYDHGTNDCESENEIETWGWIAITAFWSISNLLAFWIAFAYVYVAYHRDRHLRVYSDNQPELKQAKLNRLRALMTKAKATERFYPSNDERSTLALRRRRAVRRLRKIELEQFWMMLSHDGDIGGQFVGN